MADVCRMGHAIQKHLLKTGDEIPSLKKQDVSCVLYAFWFLNVGLNMRQKNPAFKVWING